MSDGQIVVHVAAPVLAITIDRPQKANALSEPLWRELSAGITAADSRADCTVVTICGAGNRHFSAGVDLDEVARASEDPEYAMVLAEAVVGTFEALTRLTKPSVAIVNGTAAGGGIELAVAADLRIAATGADVIFPMLGLGAPIDAISLGHLSSLVGVRWARRLLLFETRLTAERALEIGIFDEVIPANRLHQRAADVVDGVARAPRTLRQSLVAGLRNKGLDEMSLVEVQREFALGLGDVQMPAKPAKVAEVLPGSAR